MIKIGVYNELLAFRKEEQGVYLLDKEDREEVLLPNAYVSEDLEMGDIISVFVYKDSEDREVATTEIPLIFLNKIAVLEVVDVNNTGAFLNWGLRKDLLLPFREQYSEPVKGEKVVVFLTLDFKSERLIASMKMDRILDNEEMDLKEGQEVDLIVYAPTDLGFNCIVDGKYKGLLYKNEVFEELQVGEKRRGFVKKIREENKLDLVLQKQGFEVFEDHQQTVLHFLEANGGVSELNDKSTPEEIKNALKMSKKAFKKAIGMLYKDKKITISEKGIQQVS